MIETKVAVVPSSIPPAIPVATKAATTSTNISTTRVNRSTTGISSQYISYTRYLICQSRISTRAKR